MEHGPAHRRSLLIVVEDSRRAEVTGPLVEFPSQPPEVGPGGVCPMCESSRGQTLDPIAAIGAVLKGGSMGTVPLSEVRVLDPYFYTGAAS